MYEAQLAQLAQQTFNMESAALTTENLRNTMATFDAMKVANKEMQKQYGKIDIDKIEVFCGLVRLSWTGLIIRYCRPCITIWKTCSSKVTKYKKSWGVRTQFRTRLTRRTWKQVDHSCATHLEEHI
jgi:hypothetical protein